jgi:hypothetical protein
VSTPPYQPPGYPNQQPGYPPAPPGYLGGPPPTRNTRWGLIIGIIAVVVLVLCGGAVACTVLVVKAGNDVAKTVDQELHAESTDIKIRSCTYTADGSLPVAEIVWMVTNSGTITRSYAPEFVVTGPDNTQLGHGFDFVGGLAPGKQVSKTTRVYLDDRVMGTLTCALDNT